MAALRDPPADLFIGDATNQCCWILSDVLRYRPCWLLCGAPRQSGQGMNLTLNLLG